MPHRLIHWPLFAIMKRSRCRNINLVSCFGSMTLLLPGKITGFVPTVFVVSKVPNYISPALKTENRQLTVEPAQPMAQVAKRVALARVVSGTLGQYFTPGINLVVRGRLKVIGGVVQPFIQKNLVSYLELLRNRVRFA